MHLTGFLLNHFRINVKLARCCLCLSCQWSGSLVSRERRKTSLDSGRGIWYCFPFLPSCCSFCLALNARELEAQCCCKNPPVSQPGQMPPLTDTQTKFPAAGSFPGMGALGSVSCHGLLRVRALLCHVPGLFRQQIPYFNRSLLMLHLQHRSREGICHTHSLLLQNGEASQTAF